MRSLYDFRQFLKRMDTLAPILNWQLHAIMYV